MKKLLIFTDLDGSLLNHHNYDHAAADMLLANLEQRGIPVIFNTSKTRVELLQLREDFNNQQPFIAENGAAVFIPEGYFPEKPEGMHLQAGYWVKAFVATRPYWLNLVDQQRTDFSELFTPFADLEIKALIQLTGLKDYQAEAASQREYGEPIHWRGNATQKQAFIQALQVAGANVLTGGRFLHVSGDSNKGKALAWLAAQYQCYHPAYKANSAEIKTLSIGDSQNDVAMLEQADYALIIRSPSHDAPQLQRNEGVFYSQHYAPEGWVEGVNKLLDLL